MVEVNHIDRRNFEKTLANIVYCTPIRFAYTPLEEEFYSLSLNTTHGFTWDMEIMDERSYDTI